MTEAQEQRALFQWAGLAEQQYPELKLLHHIPNGGKRDARTAANLKKEGVKAGVPDMCLPVARGQYHGLYKEGYATKVCYGWLEAKESIEKYLELGQA